MIDKSFLTTRYVQLISKLCHTLYFYFTSNFGIFEYITYYHLCKDLNCRLCDDIFFERPIRNFKMIGISFFSIISILGLKFLSTLKVLIVFYAESTSQQISE